MTVRGSRLSSSLSSMKKKKVEIGIYTYIVTKPMTNVLDHPHDFQLRLSTTEMDQPLSHTLINSPETIVVHPWTKEETPSSRNL